MTYTVSVTLSDVEYAALARQAAESGESVGARAPGAALERRHSCF